jgi:hypothetical protein
VQLQRNVANCMGKVEANFAALSKHCSVCQRKNRLTDLSLRLVCDRRNIKQLTRVILHSAHQYQSYRRAFFSYLGDNVLRTKCIFSAARAQLNQSIIGIVSMKQNLRFHRVLSEAMRHRRWLVSPQLTLTRSEGNALSSMRILYRVVVGA